MKLLFGTIFRHLTCTINNCVQYVFSTFLVLLLFYSYCTSLVLYSHLLSSTPTLVQSHSTLLSFSLRYSALLSTLLYSTLLYSTLLYSTLLYSTLLYSTLLYPTPLYHKLDILPDVSLSKIYVRDFQELASAFVRLLASDLLASDLLASDLLASDLLAWREFFLAKKTKRIIYQ